MTLIIVCRVKNVGTEPINLSDLVLEYWFDGGNVQDKHPEELFKSHCMTTSPNISKPFGSDIYKDAPFNSDIVSELHNPSYLHGAI